MDGRLQRRVQRYGWDKAAAHYERHWAAQLRPSHDLLLALARLDEGQRVLDLACGTGIVTFEAAGRVGPSGSVLGTDISEGMVELARGIAHERGIANVSFERADAEDAVPDPRGFDACLCALGLMYMPDPEAAVRSMFAALAPGGRASVSVWGQRSRCGWAELFPIVDARVQSEVCPMFFRLGGGDAMLAAMRDAGFIDVTVERIATRLDFRSDEDACGAAFLGGPVALAYARFDEATRVAVHAEYLASISGYRSGSAYAVPGEFVVATGTRPA